MTDAQKTPTLDAETVRHCARKVLGIQYHAADTEVLRAASSNQALYAYDALMRLIDPDRSLAVSIAEAREIDRG